MSIPSHPLRLSCCCLLVAVAVLGFLHAGRKDSPESKAAEAKHVVRRVRRDAAFPTADLALTDPQRALQLAGQIYASDVRLAEQYRCLREWTLRDPDAAADWAMRIEDDSERSQALAEVAATWASFDPLAAARLTAEFISTPAALERAIPAAVAQASPRDQPQVREWIESFPQCPLKDLAQAELTRLARQLPAAPASLPGEATEQRRPPLPQTKNP